MKQRHQLITVKRAPVNEASREIDFILSTADEDRVGDTIDAAGWELENYLANPVVLWGHDRRLPPIGKAVNVRVEGGQLRGACQFAPPEANPLAETVYQLYRGGYLSAVSVGFQPKEWVYRDDGGIDFKRQELLEFSAVTIPANPQCLARAKGAGIDLQPLADPYKARTADPRHTEAWLIATGLAERMPVEHYDEDGILVGRIMHGKLELDPDYQANLAKRNLDAIAQRHMQMRHETHKRRARLKAA